MRVLQLIDSLRSGGAERMAVTYANALAKRVDGSFLCCTRLEGVQREELLPEVRYLFLEKKNVLDLKAFFRLRDFIKKNRIDLLQAHSTSFFLAVLVKVSLPNLKLVWHEHYGERALKDKKPGILRSASYFFDGVITVNSELEFWAKRHLKVKQVRYIRNFLSLESKDVGKGSRMEDCKGEKIVCLANLRNPKDHLNLLKAYKMLATKHKDLSLHLIGKDSEDDYSGAIKKFIKDNNWDGRVFMYGEQQEIFAMLKQADLGVLSSASEGLPVALLEYGRAGLPVVCTRVGECKEVIGETGKLVPSGDAESLAEAIDLYLENEEQRKSDAAAFQKKIREEFSEEVVLPKVLNFFESLCTARSDQQLQAQRTTDNRK